MSWKALWDNLWMNFGTAWTILNIGQPDRTEHHKYGIKHDKCWTVSFRQLFLSSYRPSLNYAELLIPFWCLFLILSLRTAGVIYSMLSYIIIWIDETLHFLIASVYIWKRMVCNGHIPKAKVSLQLGGTGDEPIANMTTFHLVCKR